MKLYQLQLRDLFWLMLACALAMGWWVDRGVLQAKIDGVVDPVNVVDVPSEAPFCGGTAVKLEDFGPRTR